MLPLPANWIAVPPGAAMIAPASKMLTGCAVLISMPAEPEITPKLEMPPVKVGPAMAIAVLLGENLARAVDQDAVARRLDCAAVDDRAGDGAVRIGMPVFAVIAPLLIMSPAKRLGQSTATPVRASADRAAY